MIQTAQICAKLQTSSNQSNEEEPINGQDEDEALDGSLKGVVSMYMCKHPLSYT